MASTITITCPECEKQLRVSSETVGKRVRCKGCDETFVVRAPKGSPEKAAKAPAKKAPAKPAKQEAVRPGNEDDDNNPYGMTEEYLGRRCPFCANAMDEDAVICLECGYNTRTREKAKKKRVQDQTGMDYFLWLLPGILCVILALTVIGLDVYFIVQVTAESLGEDNWYSFLGGMGTKIWATVIATFIVYKLGRFAVNRLVFNNKPPEVELRDTEKE